MADNISAVLNIPAGLDKTYESIDKSIANMSKSIDAITAKLGNGGMKALLDVKVDSKSLDKELDEVKKKMSEIPEMSGSIQVKLQATEALEGLREMSRLVKEIGTSHSVVMAAKALNEAVEKVNSTVATKASGVSSEKGVVDIEKEKAKIAEIKANIEELKRSASAHEQDLLGLKFEDNQLIKYKEEILAIKEALREMKVHNPKGAIVSKEEMYAEEKELRRMVEVLKNATRAYSDYKKAKKQAAKDDELAREVESVERSVAASQTAIESIDTSTVEGARQKLKELKQQMQEIKSINKDHSKDGMLAQLQKDAEATEKQLRILSSYANRVNRDALALRANFMNTFNIMGIIAFYKNVVKIRGEFEMIQKSLKVLVGDADRSKQIFNEIQAIAIESPYEIKDLARQTKQLAAYGIEVDKLVEKTKMLGDIASGTGVDIQRLGLAYGQIRAAQFLKGTEARQLTEAGVDIYGALSRYYTELEGKMVSVSEIMDRQRRKLITFEDVDTVLKGMTSLGGKFYKMQEQQAQTIQGMMSNLRDRASKMFNEIGENYEGIIKKIITLMNWILSHSGAVQTAVMGWASYRIFNMLNIALGKIPDNLAKVENAEKRAVAIWNSFAKSAPKMSGWIKNTLSIINKYPSAIAAAGAAIAILIALIARATKLNRELNSIDKEYNNTIREETNNYMRLASVLKSDTASRQDKAKALEELKAQYGEIIPLQRYEIDNLGELEGACEGNIRAIREYLKQKELQKKKEAIIDNVEDNSQTGLVTKQVKNALNRSLKEINAARKANGEAIIEFTQGEIGAAIEQMVGDLTEGKIKSIKEAIQSLVHTLSQMRAGITSDWEPKALEILYNAASQAGISITVLAQQYLAAVKKIDEITRDSKVSTVASDAINEAAKNVKDAYNNFLFEAQKGGDSTSKYFKNSALAEKDALSTAESVMESELQKLDEMWANAVANDEAWANNPETLAYIKNAIRGALADVTPTAIEAAWRDTFAQVNADLKAKMGTIPFEIGKDNGTDRKLGQSAAEYKKEMLQIVKERQSAIDAIGKEAVEGSVQWETFVETFALSGFIKELGKELDSQNLSPEEYRKKLRDGAVALAQATNDALEDAANSLKTKSKEELAAEARDYKNSVASFVKELRDTLKEWDELDDIGQQIQKRILDLKAKKLNIELPKLSSKVDFSELVQNLFEKGKLTNEQKLELDLIINTEKTKQSIEDLKNQADELWEHYEFLKNLEDLEISVDGTKAFEVLDEISKVEDELRNKDTKDSIKQADDIKKKRLDKLRQERDEALKIMSDANKKSYDQTIKITKEAYADVSKIINDANKGAGADIKDASGNVVGKVPTVSEEEIQKAVNNRLSKAYEDVEKAQWDAYKGTEMYIAAFGNLDDLGTEVIRTLQSELRKFAENTSNLLTPTELKQIQNTIMDMDEELAHRTGAKTFTGSLIEGIRNIEQVRKTYDEEVKAALGEWQAELAAVDEAKKKQLNMYNALKRAEESLAKARSQYDNEGGEGMASRDTVEALDKATRNAAEANANYEDAINEVTNATNRANNAGQKYTRVVKKLSTTINAAKQRLADIKDQFDTVSGAIVDSINYAEECAEAFGVAFDEDTIEIIESFSKGFTLVSGAMGLASSFMEVYTIATINATAATATLETLLWPLLLVAAALGTIMAALKASDLAIQDNIDMHKKAIENLEKQYSNLEESISKALSMNEVGSTYEKQLQNLEKQRQELEEIIILEKSRKNPDEDALDDYRDQLDDLVDEAKKAKEKLDDILGKPSDYQSMAKSWSSAWLDAFKETGDGMDALQDSFEDMYNDILVGQLQNLIVGPAMEKLKGKIEEITSDLIITSDEASSLKKLKEEMLSQINDSNKALMSMLGETSNAAFSADTIQKGISSLTEDTGIALESLANSMRAHLASIDGVLQSALGSGGEDVENPIVNQLKAQTELTRDIKNLLNSVLKSGHRQSGWGIKVFTD